MIFIMMKLFRKHEFDKSGSLPRFALRTIWANGKLDVVREGTIFRSKITENGKKLRKSMFKIIKICDCKSI